MKNVFFTDGRWQGKIPRNHVDIRNDSAWMHLLDAVHHPIYDYNNIRGFDNVFIMFPKGKLSITADATRAGNVPNPASELLRAPIVETLKQYNDKVHYIQEGATWWFNDYEVEDQLLFYNFLFDCDSIFTHNEYDIKFYRGLFPNKKIRPIQTIMFDDGIKHITPTKEEKCIVGGNFARWYGGFQSFIVAQEFNVPIWIPTSHAKRENEHNIDGVNHLPRLVWNDWMGELSKFKYAIHLMPTIAAGTFNLNCSYWGIPCIGHEKVDTQRLLHPDLAVDVDDVESAQKLAHKLVTDVDFYNHCSTKTKELYNIHYNPDNWLSSFMEKL